MQKLTHFWNVYFAEYSQKGIKVQSQCTLQLC